MVCANSFDISQYKNGEVISITCTHIDTNRVSEGTFVVRDGYLDGQFDVPVIDSFDVLFWLGELQNFDSNIINGFQYNVKVSH